MDEVTEHWPVKQSFKSELHDIKFAYQAIPLPVYVGDRLIKTHDVPAMLSDALVEVSFELRHFCIKKKNEDSFNASVQQIVILQPGKTRPANAFKRRNVFDSPLRPCVSVPCFKQ